MSGARAFAVVWLFLLALMFPQGPRHEPAFKAPRRMHFAHAKPLPAGQEITLDFRTQHYQIFRIDAPRGTVIDLKVEQKGVDVELFFFQDRVTPYEIDSPNGQWGPERVATIAIRPSFLVVAALERSNGLAVVDWRAPSYSANGADHLRASATLHYSMAKALKRRRLESAEAFYALSIIEWTALGDHEATYSAVWDSAQALEEMGDYGSAVNRYKQLLSVRKKDRDARNHLAFCYYALGSLAKARHIYRDLLSEAEESGSHQEIGLQVQNLALLDKSSGQLREAIRGYDYALKLSVARGERETILSNRGNAFLDLGLYDEAIADYHAALDLAPNDLSRRALLIRTIAMSQMRAGRLGGR